MKTCPHCKKPAAKSGYHGVSQHSQTKYYRAIVQNDHLGSYKNPEDAARRVDEEVLARGLNYPLNFPRTQNGL